MPVGKAVIRDHVEAFWIEWVSDIEQDAVARACASSKVFRREYRDVVALIGGSRLLGVVAVIPTTPKTGNRSSFFIRENGGGVDDARGRWVIDGDFYDVDAK